MKDGFLRAAAAIPVIQVADRQHNGSAIIDPMREAEQQQMGVVVFPELCLTGYTCGDLFRDGTLIVGAGVALSRILREMCDMCIIVVVGAPVALDTELYNTAAVIYQGRILGLVTKRSIPSYSEFYRARHFPLTSATREIPFCG